MLLTHPYLQALNDNGHLEHQATMQFFTILSASLMLITATQLVAAQSQCTTFRCPPTFGACNKCIKFNGQIVAITRQICDGYSLQKCKLIFHGATGLCEDGCNRCACTATGLASTISPCSPYSMDMCLGNHSSRPWVCGASMCICTPCGIGFLP